MGNYAIICKIEADEVQFVHLFHRKQMYEPRLVQSKQTGSDQFFSELSGAGKRPPRWANTVPAY